MATIGIQTMSAPTGDTPWYWGCSYPQMGSSTLARMDVWPKTI